MRVCAPSARPEPPTSTYEGIKRLCGLTSDKIKICETVESSTITFTMMTMMSYTLIAIFARRKNIKITKNDFKKKNLTEKF